MYNSELTTKGNNDFGDTTLRLDSFGYGTAGETKKPKNERADESRRDDDDACELVLGPTTTTTYSKGSSSHSRLQLGLALPEVEGSDPKHNPFKRSRGQLDDEGSTSVKRWSGGYLTNLVLAPSMGSAVAPRNGPKPHSLSAFSVFEPGSTITTTASSSDARRSSKMCMFARGRNGPGGNIGRGGETGLFCGSAGKGSLDYKGGLSSGLSVMSDSYGSYKRRGGLIPPQVLVPLSMKASVGGGADELSGPEGRVHGGALLSSLRNEDDDL